MASDPSQSVFDGQRLVVGVTGGISAYKTATVVSRLAQSGAEVTVCMTDAAVKFIAPLTFEALSGRLVRTSAFMNIESSDPQHINLATQADAIVVAPTSMDFLARLAVGLAGDIVSLTLAAVDRARTPVILAPAMNTVMWSQPATQRNLAQLKDDGYLFVGPDDGWQACRAVGPGRMAEPEAIVEALAQAIRQRAR